MATTKQIERLRQSFCNFLRFGNQLMRGQASCCPVTMEQYHTLDVLLDGPQTMKKLASGVGFHQSTMTRIVEKLNAQELVLRTRKRSNQRHVDVEITEKGKQVCLSMRNGCSQMMSWLLDAIPKNEQESVVKSMETFTNLFNPENKTFQEMCQTCCCKPVKKLEK
jgi:DNA-binding MarR family transcriptional regulator